jgi:hypothetical protein
MHSWFTVHCLPFPLYLSARTRTGVRVAEGAGLENRYTLTGIVGSNPTLSVLSQRLAGQLEPRNQPARNSQ